MGIARLAETPIQAGVLSVSLLLAGLAPLQSHAEGVDDGSRGWGVARRLTFDPGSSELSINFARSIATGRRRAVHAVWTDSRDGLPDAPQVYYKRSLDGGRWGPDIRLSTAPGTRQNPAIASSRSNVYVVWFDTRDGNLNVYLKRSTDQGSSWGPDTRLTSSGSAAYPSIAVWRRRVHVVWGDTRDGNAEIYTRRSADGGATWDPEQLLSELPYESWVPTVAVSRRNVLVAWVDYRDANEEEYLRRSTDRGLTWEPPTRVTEDPADSWAPSLAVRGRHVHLAWFDRRDAGVSDLDVEAKLDEALALVGLPPDPAPPRDPAVYYLPPFHQRVQEKLAAVMAAAPGWVQAGNAPALLEALLTQFQSRMKDWSTGWSIYYRHSRDGGATWGPDTRISTPNGPAARPSIAAVGRRLHVVWYDGRHGDTEVYYRRSRDRGTSFGPEIRLTDSAGASLRPSVAAKGRFVHVLWHDERDGNAEIYHRRKVK